MTIDVTFQPGLDTSREDNLRAQLKNLRGLDEVLQWCLVQKPPIIIDEVVIQDEFTHDVIAQLGPELWAVFDST